MKFLYNYDLNELDINKIKEKYNNAIISSFIYKKNNVIKLLDFFKDKGFNLKSLLLNRLDIFLVDYQIIYNKLSKYNNIDFLKDDISIIDFI